MLPSQWASSGHKRTKLHFIHRGTAFQTSAKGADVDHDVYFARESLQDGLRRAVQTEQTVNHNEAVCVQSVDVCWTSLSPLTFFCFVFFFPSPFWLFLSHPLAIFRNFGLSFHVQTVSNFQTVPFGHGPRSHLEISGGLQILLEPLCNLCCNGAYMANPRRETTGGLERRTQCDT